ncbi:aldehyde dehydrogenase family protein, partial [Streptomyces clavuligerus]|uniref:aldehyde dehydrogenase family protein n=1 Tax=Streptomyces clavuligerus TaxID=1901 RepID=UPI0018D1CCA3
NYIAGQFVADASARTLEVFSPISGAVISTVPLSGMDALDQAVEAARGAFPAWSAMPIKERVQIFYRYKTLLEKNLAELTDLVREENGKTTDEARAEVEKAIELTEFACSLPQLVAGEMLEVSAGVECRVDRKPLGVVASIAPFNFPNMVPH